jgi:branched-chain amino acid transport system substrate-binding protein
MEQLDVINEQKLPMLDAWAAADAIVENTAKPNYAFRLSLTDSWAMQALLKHARSRGLYKIGVVAPANVWGRSCLAAIERDLARNRGVVVSVQSYYWGGEKTLAKHYRAIREAGAQAVILIANEADGALLVKDIASLPPADRLPILSHWGILTGRFIELSGEALNQVDLVTVTTRTLIPARNAAAKKLIARGTAYFKVDDPAKIIALPGLAHAYDLTHLLARAINKAGSTDREKIRAALESLPPYEGAIKRYQPAFTASRHEALSVQNVHIARFTADGRVVLLED